jgi:acyl-coenzyme A thioesterase PaaI-like protein
MRMYYYTCNSSRLFLRTGRGFMDGTDPDVASTTADAAPRLLPAHTADCFGCGDNNASGFHLVVWRAGDEIHTDFAFDERYMGGPGLAHGGAIAGVCDELLGFTVWLIGAPAVTRALTIDYLAPVPLREIHRITAKVDMEKGRAIHVSAKGVSSGGKLSFTASGIYVRVPFEHFGGFGTMPTPTDELRERLERESGRP